MFEPPSFTIMVKIIYEYPILLRIMVSTRYISADTAPVFKSHTGITKHRILIYGDLVHTFGNVKNGRKKIKYGTTMNKEGWIENKSLMTKPVLETYFIDVGQGDSTFIVTPARKKILIDGGKNDRALRFLSWKYNLAERDPNDPVVIDLLVVSHADSDHINGLIPIVAHKKFKVKKIIHSGLAVFKEGSFDENLGDVDFQSGEKFIVTSHSEIDELDDLPLVSRFKKWKKAIEDEGDVEYFAVDSKTGQIDIGDPDIKIEVVGPRLDVLDDGTLAYKWLCSKHGPTINGHSVLLRLSYNGVKLLLSGDLNEAGAEHLLLDSALGKKMDAHILKAPHHGSGDFSDHWLRAVNPQISVISSGDSQDYGHPAANFVASVGNASRSKTGSLVFSTEIAATFVESGTKDQKIVGFTTEQKKNLTKKQLKILKGMFLRRLHGMINVRTDGKILFAARRTTGVKKWESYSDIIPSKRTPKCKND